MDKAFHQIADSEDHKRILEIFDHNDELNEAVEKMIRMYEEGR